MTFVMVGVEQAVRRRPAHHLGEYPAEVHRILQTGVGALTADGVVHMGGVADVQRPPAPVGCRLPGRVGEAGNRCGTVNFVIGAIDGDEGGAENREIGFSGSVHALLGHHDPDGTAIVIAEGVHAARVSADPPLRCPAWL